MFIKYLIKKFFFYRKLFTAKQKNIEGKVYLFFDEIQHVKDWKKSINSYRVLIDSDIYIAGSNSQLLSGELATLLTGRYLIIIVIHFHSGSFCNIKMKLKG